MEKTEAIKSGGKLRIAFLGGVFKKGREKEIFEKSKIFVYAAADVHQKRIINGLKNLPDIELTLINSVFVGTWPREYRDPVIPYGAWSEDGISCVETGYLNLFGVRSFWRASSVYRALDRWCRENEGGERALIVYSMLTPFAKAAARVKRKYPSLKICYYVPDIPDYFTQNKAKGALYRFLKKYDCAAAERCLWAADFFVLLTAQMNARVNPAGKPYAVIEGIVSADEIKAREREAPSGTRVKNIVYTGKTDAEFGILELIEAFKYIDDKSVALDIYGGGNADRELREASQKDGRIRFFGPAARGEVLKKQREAFILVNPRNPKREFTEYSFPSKTMEYLAAARPVVMHRLAGIPREYDRYLIYFKSDEPRSMAETLIETLSKSEEELARLGEEGENFILENKNEEIQGRKLAALIKGGKDG